MDVQSAIERNHDALMRIAAMLLALGALAERLSGLSRPVRCLVLWILRPAEVVAREFVAEAMQAPLPAFTEFPAMWSDDGASDALRLARHFRALAAALGDLSRQAARVGRREARTDRPRGRFGHFPGGRLRVWNPILRLSDNPSASTRPRGLWPGPIPQHFVCGSGSRNDTS